MLKTLSFRSNDNEKEDDHRQRRDREAETQADLDGPTRRWLNYEQTVNEHVFNRSARRQVKLSKRTVRAPYHPERRGVWPQKVVWLPSNRVRTYGWLKVGMRAAFGVDLPAGRMPLLLHPQPPAAHRRLAKRYRCVPLDGVSATPTSSYRTVLAWQRGRRPVFLKLSLGASVLRIRRALTENDVACGVVMSSLFETITPGDQRRLPLNWFSEPAGMVETYSGHGWLLRPLPRAMSEPRGGWLVPVFSLISRRGGRVPLLVDLIGRTRLRPETFVVERLLRPYVEALSYLLFVQGIQVEGHTQNVLVETDRDENLTGRIVLRDLSDASVSIAMRVAGRKSLPVFPPGFFPAKAPFPLASVAADHRCKLVAGSLLLRGGETVEIFGLRILVANINASLARFFGNYDATRVARAYLRLWQQASARFLRIRPPFRKNPEGLATDEALACFLRNVDWKGLGSTGGACLPGLAERLLIERQVRRQSGPVYERLECAWGDLFLRKGLPAFFRPAF